jgi:hypothetical protein
LITAALLAPMIVIVGACGLPRFSDASGLTSTGALSPLRRSTIWFWAG